MNKNKLILPSLLFFMTFAHANLLEDIKTRGVIKIGVSKDKFPFGYEENGNLVGFDVELSRELGKHLLGDDAKIELVPMDSMERVPAILGEQVDLVIANFTKTDLRARTVSFAQPYMKVELNIASPKNARIGSLSELFGKRLIVVSGTTAETYFKNFKNITLVPVKGNSAAFNALKEGKGDAIAHNDSILNNWVNKNSDYEITITDIANTKENIAPALKKEEKELLAWINSEMQSLQNNGRLHSIYEQTLVPSFGEVAFSYLPQ